LKTTRSKDVTLDLKIKVSDLLGSYQKEGRGGVTKISPDKISPDQNFSPTFFSSTDCARGMMVPV